MKWAITFELYTPSVGDLEKFFYGGVRILIGLDTSTRITTPSAAYLSKMSEGSWISNRLVKLINSFWECGLNSDIGRT